jgi:hypothetical protein
MHPPAIRLFVVEKVRQLFRDPNGAQLQLKPEIAAGIAAGTCQVQPPPTLSPAVVAAAHRAFARHHSRTMHDDPQSSLLPDVPFHNKRLSLARSLSCCCFVQQHINVSIKVARNIMLVQLQQQQQ